jgi:predicted nucleic acid-binding protein
VILVDTSIWIDHLRAGDSRLVALLEQMDVLVHPFVIGELALGNLRGREAVIESLKGLPALSLAADDDVMAFINSQSLQGTGIGYIDAHLLTSAKLNAGVRLWTRDKRLKAVADQVGLALSEELPG